MTDDLCCVRCGATFGPGWIKCIVPVFYKNKWRDVVMCRGCFLETDSIHYNPFKPEVKKK